MTSLRQTSGINCNNNAKRCLDSRLQISLINIACFWLFVSASKSEVCNVSFVSQFKYPPKLLDGISSYFTVKILVWSDGSTVAQW